MMKRTTKRENGFSERAEPPPNGLAEGERRYSIPQRIVEGLFYLGFLGGLFQLKLGLTGLPFLIGGIITLGGVFAALVFLFSRERVPISIWFVVGINAAANFSQVLRGEWPILGEGLRPLLNWLSLLLTLCCIIQNEKAQKRVLFVLSGAFLLATVLGSSVNTTNLRMEVEGVSVGATNANTLAYVLGLLCVAMLFWSLRRSQALRFILWGMCFSLFYYLVLTVSRGGMLAFALGFSMLIFSILLGRGVRLGGIFFIIFSIVLASQFAYIVSSQLSNLKERASESTPRTNIYRMETFVDLRDTMFVGWGTEKKVLEKRVHAHMEPHNAFLYLHVALGGITAWIYLFWLIGLAIRIKRVMFSSRHRLDEKCEVVALFVMMLMAQLFSNWGFLYITTIYATAYIEKYAMQYTRRAINARRVMVGNAA